MCSYCEEPFFLLFVWLLAARCRAVAEANRIAVQICSQLRRVRHNNGIPRALYICMRVFCVVCVATRTRLNLGREEHFWFYLAHICCCYVMDVCGIYAKCLLWHTDIEPIDIYEAFVHVRSNSFFPFTVWLLVLVFSGKFKELFKCWFNKMDFDWWENDRRIYFFA